MANPTSPKDAKPKAEGEDFEVKQTTKVNTTGAPVSMVNLIAIIVGIVVIVCANYFLIDMKMSQLSKTIGTVTEEAAEEEAGDEENVAAERGIILDLGEFILNLADTNSRKFLKVEVAIELTKKDTDSAMPEAKGGHGEKEGASSMAAVEAEMNQFKPAIRDAVISILSGKTSSELATTPGKELAKEQIKEAINAVFEGDREVLRVSFGSFFIQ